MCVHIVYACFLAIRSPIFKFVTTYDIVPMHPSNDTANILKIGFEVHELIFKRGMLLLPPQKVQPLFGIELGYKKP